MSILLFASLLMNTIFLGYAGHQHKYSVGIFFVFVVIVIVLVWLLSQIGMLRGIPLA